jgi:pimeloyl-ACP methyl ester carboxylesterase
MPFAERGTYRLHFETRGRTDAPPVLLVMGLGLSSGAWGALPDRLAERFHVITFDNRGTGRSTRTGGLFRAAELADDAAAVLDVAGVSCAAVFGISMGGMIAIELTLRHAARVRSLALGCTYAGYLRSKKPAAGSLVDFARVVASPGPGTRETLARLLVSPGYYAREREAFFAWLAGAEPADVGTTLRQIAAVLRHDAEARLHELRVPTLVLSGDSDRLVPVDNSRRLAHGIAGARLVELAGAGHCFALEREEETAQRLAAHFADPPAFF